MTSTVVGILLVFAAVSPGFAFVASKERYRVRGVRSELRELAEALSVGGFTSLTSLALVLGLLTRLHWLSGPKFADFAESPSTWIAGNPDELWYVVFVLLSVVGLSSLFAAGLPRLSESHIGETVLRGIKVRAETPVVTDSDVWQLILHEEEMDVRCIVELDDGRRISGWAYHWSFRTQHQVERDLALVEDIWIQRTWDADWIKLTATHILLKTENIRSIDVEHVERNLSPKRSLKSEAPVVN